MNAIIRSILLLALASFATDCLALPILRTVALTGQPAPGLPPGSFFEQVYTDGPDYYSEPQIDNQGRVAFTATFPSLWEDHVYGYWSEGSGSLEILAGSGTPPSGAPATANDFIMFAYPVLDRTGKSYFWSMSQGPGLNPANNIGVWAGKAGSLSVVLKGNSPAPGLPPGVLFRYGTSAPVTAVSENGSIAFFGYLQGAGVNTANSEALWVGMPNSLQLLARSGDQAPGINPGYVFATFDADIRINSTGESVFLAAMHDPVNNPAVWKQGIWINRSGSTLPVAVTGEQAPGTTVGTKLDGFGFNAVINNAGRVAFAGQLSGPGTTPVTNEAIWHEKTNGLELLARTGSAAPGTAAGTVFSHLMYHGLAFDASGNAIFRAELAGSGVNSMNNFGVWRVVNDSLTLVLREGDQAPELLPGISFSYAPFPSLNINGQMAFISGLRGSSVNFSNDQGIWASDLGGQLRLIVREGELLEVAPGDFRTISELSMLTSLGYSESYRAFNSKGQLTFGAKFTDGTSGVFVSNLVAIPEPTIVSIVLLTLLNLVARRTDRWHSGRLG
jgi:hypothetical protein